MNLGQLEFMINIMFVSHDERICHIQVCESESLGQPEFMINILFVRSWERVMRMKNDEEEG